MKTILSEYTDTRLPRAVQLRRMNRVIENELTPLQRQLIEAIYFQNKSQKQVALERGVCCSTVCRTLHRAEARMRRFLRY
ncbi:MAG: hypothetical protein LBM28_06610 [Oscillospiraceae bacterium]|jgi:RNA polymerase sigma factor (sigma-70 family)|nr:hypothetical protein [Oscillospiraceae bacterium]